MHARDPTASELERHPGARGLVRSGAVEDELPRAQEFPLVLVELVERQPAAARDRKGRCLDLEPRAEIDDRDRLAGVESALELRRRDAGDPERAQEQPA